ncbi:MAG: hypothetical protein OEZ03_02135 [Alphaproteobacteria bacterium]|nr:hypothetical protein [Alphaproteobacteria bacterium]MDH5556117.1 hypothetical protein [Alphaproteobacteria bacterium]
MPRVIKMLAMAAVAAGWASMPAAGQDAIGKAFSDALFKEEQITRSVREHPDVSGLQKEEMNAILQARDSLTGFFAALKSGDKVKEYLNPVLASRYSDAIALRRERFGAETYLSYEIFDFRINETMTQVKLRYFLAQNDRGDALIRQRAITFERAGGGWKISEFDNFDFD